MAVNIITFVNLAIQIEDRALKCYAILSRVAGEVSAAAELRALSEEELDHKQTLIRGKSYILKYPDLFGDPALPGEEVEMSVHQVQRLLADLESGRIDFGGGLKAIDELEKRLEKVHMTVALEIKDESLKKLFETLQGSDKDHERRLNGLLKKQKP